MDNVADYYNFSGQADNPPDSKNSLHDSGFVSPANISLPLAKIIPVLSSQVTLSIIIKHPCYLMCLQVKLEDDEDDQWLGHLSQSPSLKTLGANVYESFSSRNKVEREDNSWSSWFNSTVDKILH